MRIWPSEIGTIQYGEILTYCVNDEQWQKFRLTLKGLTTEQKLDKLFLRYMDPMLRETRERSRRIDVQVWNYINALKRGGQLSSNLRVQR